MKQVRTEHATTSFKGYGLVRDKDGKPIIDDPTTLHPAHLAMLTRHEREELGLWPGLFIEDAAGFQRATVIKEDDRSITLKTDDPLRAARIIWLGGKPLVFAKRIDTQLGETLTLVKPQKEN